MYCMYLHAAPAAKMIGVGTLLGQAFEHRISTGTCAFWGWPPLQCLLCQKLQSFGRADFLLEHLHAAFRFFFPTWNQLFVTFTCYCQLAAGGL